MDWESSRMVSEEVAMDSDDNAVTTMAGNSSKRRKKGCVCIFFCDFFRSTVSKVRNGGYMLQFRGGHGMTVEWR